LGLDTDSFTECIDSNRYEEEVQADFDYASQLGIRSTPTFFINGIALVGAQPYDVFKQVIDQELAGELD
jgi:predicted DsbA family dithiol-disulfide isomerase